MCTDDVSRPQPGERVTVSYKSEWQPAEVEHWLNPNDFSVRLLRSAAPGTHRTICQMADAGVTWRSATG
jgi:hypothetical protein